MIHRPTQYDPVKILQAFIASNEMIRKYCASGLDGNYLVMARTGLTTLLSMAIIDSKNGRVALSRFSLSALFAHAQENRGNIDSFAMDQIEQMLDRVLTVATNKDARRAEDVWESYHPMVHNAVSLMLIATHHKGNMNLIQDWYCHLMCSNDHALEIEKVGRLYEVAANEMEADLDRLKITVEPLFRSQYGEHIPALVA